MEPNAVGRISESIGAVMTKIVRYFPDTDLRAGHDMLADKAIRNKINVKALGRGEFVVFVNRAKTALKMFAGSANLVAYLRLEKGKLDLRTISLIPEYFDGSEIKYDLALKKVIEKDLGNRPGKTWNLVS